ncbi:MAG TPA: tRNA uridine-5-carboxymethylaminomethyl(34) synthesis GTPase MnmE [Bacteroidales bacterium]|nr:tRNA uridine-5-carboxymethylaminomethyl(34) synthesis GTPase MnmE [Bacteroidales bacterium]
MANIMVQSGTTICAPATSGGGAIAVIRMSGEKALEVLSSVFLKDEKKVEPGNLKGYSLHFGSIYDGADFLDEVLVSVFRAPLSYTGEDMVEISCHASSHIQQRLIKLLISKGVTAAAPGEFTMRAFMNGKMDLSQAEAVADLIASESEAAHRLAANQLRGGFSAEISKLRNELLQFASLVELELDFSEEDVEFADRHSMIEKIISIKNLVDSLASSFRLGNAIKNGIPVVIAGRPNVGKSSLLNALLKEERAIVSSIPGTTRDYIEESVHIGGLLFRFIDTAGLRDSDDTIESMGIERTLKKMDEAEVIIALVEASDSESYVREFVGSIKMKAGGKGKTIIVVANKLDMIPEYKEESIVRSISGATALPVIMISATGGTGIEELKEMLLQSVDISNLESPQYIVTNARHYHALEETSSSLEAVLSGFRNGIPTELITTDLRQAIYHLGEITGQITSDEILGEIFRNFCIGK